MTLPIITKAYDKNHKCIRAIYKNANDNFNIDEVMRDLLSDCITITSYIIIENYKNNPKIKIPLHL